MQMVDASDQKRKNFTFETFLKSTFNKIEQF